MFHSTFLLSKHFLAINVVVSNCLFYLPYCFAVCYARLIKFLMFNITKNFQKWTQKFAWDISRRFAVTKKHKKQLNIFDTNQRRAEKNTLAHFVTVLTTPKNYF
jgi:hypothetical protein